MGSEAVPVWLVDLWVEDNAGCLKEPFSPAVVACETGVDLGRALRRCLELVLDGRLELVWEMFCPACFCKWRKAGPDISCPSCGKVLSFHDVYLLFSVTPEYRKHVAEHRSKRIVFSYSRTLRRAGK
ncbi:hypothetical protein Desku_0751 [Desulfofundulus kuznetsovii DSM 6115]|uniref:Uncharacterized protein n=1 Tax=Desulfofundulus kuznetsovii (strain DSM 6115 / VKM B-1805 / 17) TaxID=760568 RepID=A0AAU8P914_DESK7|nr:hypothetical protein Desku_0751 [Desulfofundulus kuznetsovii DSM 6115]